MKTYSHQKKKVIILLLNLEYRQTDPHVKSKILIKEVEFEGKIPF